MRAAREALSANSALLFGMALLTLGAGLQATLLGVRATFDLRRLYSAVFRTRYEVYDDAL